MFIFINFVSLKWICHIARMEKKKSKKEHTSGTAYGTQISWKIIKQKGEFVTVGSSEVDTGKLIQMEEDIREGNGPKELSNRIEFNKINQ